jgi:hypothetical protein
MKGGKIRKVKITEREREAACSKFLSFSFSLPPFPPSAFIASQVSIQADERTPTNFRALGTYRSNALFISVRWLTDKTIMAMDTQVIPSPLFFFSLALLLLPLRHFPSP